MDLALSPSIIVLVVTVTIVAGAINGVAGFGFALVGTMVLATVVDPATAVVFMILPILSVNASLVSDLSGSQLVTCGRRFWPLIIASLVGTLVGMALLNELPDGLLRVGLGVVTLGFVVGSQRLRPLPGLFARSVEVAIDGPAVMIAVGVISGVLFGGTNVGVQLIAYLRSLDLSHGLFVGVVALVFVGLNAARVGVAGLLGLYPNVSVFVTSMAATVPALIGVSAGKRIRNHGSAGLRRRAVLGLLSLVGFRLVLGGLGIV